MTSFEYPALPAGHALHVNADTWREIEAYAHAADLARKRDRELDKKAKRSARILYTLSVIAALAIIALMAVHVYNGANAGVVIGPEYAHVGLEIRGDPGIFVGLGDRQWSIDRNGLQ